MEINYELYLITDRRFLKGRQLKKIVEDAILGGVTIVQVREKDVSTREFYNVAKEVKEVTDYYKVPIIINDRLDIAQAIDASGVHLGQKDMHLNIAREILGKDKIIGISVGNVKEALEAQNNGADYLGIGTIFPTGSKKDVDAIIGIDGLSKIKDSISIPSVAIGGINKTNFKDVLKTGIEGISVISAILDEDDIKLAANNLLINK
ncbi:thiamine phosphate synthase [Clostridium botulinum]|uniref:Thiamine-phosphate synthase n=1 Tax=Clostridium botulinum (strain Kyoto / Type A2) TaxID=536232 RepID=THIE_CLOBJ|nr:thiamine phosphate synthase [Clostridium botulinum]C1FSC1.1 RecName: Full=Thiamine-phosphate synthase; Short=TP synthase; Short=TPS; AltName: Full=Thiamine-phosphate pyrophosphorylase; Short=TMP pyrophosphorylase; Short=TMP-PPase [Clostridium botulinum A2 str. Kyoto]ACO85552.1 thiamine-phosphate diphosphorylase [Clostridium botulinum A2 str. Kyoto]APC83796.1 thiamine-phosphate diphosphorylase [Clostridium botulinum]APH24729.1 thiamine-phosphate diphosphorylase [Clostridium botulinum]APQ7093